MSIGERIFEGSGEILVGLGQIRMRMGGGKWKGVMKVG